MNAQELAEDRVRDFVERETARRKNSPWEGVDILGAPLTDMPLRLSDLRELVAEVKAWRDRARELERKRDDARRELALRAPFSGFARDVIEMLGDEP